VPLCHCHTRFIHIPALLHGLIALLGILFIIVIAHLGLAPSHLSLYFLPLVLMLYLFVAFFTEIKLAGFAAKDSDAPEQRLLALGADEFVVPGDELRQTMLTGAVGVPLSHPLSLGKGRWQAIHWRSWKAFSASRFLLVIALRGRHDVTTYYLVAFEVLESFVWIVLGWSWFFFRIEVLLVKLDSHGKSFFVLRFRVQSSF